MASKSPLYDLFLKHFFLFFLMFSFSNGFSSSLHAKYELETNQDLTFWQWNSPLGSYAIHYIEKGSGPHHVILQHGFAAHSFTWRFIMDELAKAGYHVWSMDLIGYGLSDKPTNIAYNFQLFLNQMEAFMQAKHIDQASLIGNSMGGALVLAQSIYHPDRVKSLVLIDALSFPMPLPFYFSLTRTFGKWMKPFMGRFVVKQILKEIIYDPNKITEEQIKAYSLPLSMPGGKDALVQTLQNFSEIELDFLSSHFKDIHVPTLIIWGENDDWMPLSYFHQLSQAFPQAHTLVIPRCGHAPQEECPAEVNQALLHFFEHLKR